MNGKPLSLSGWWRMKSIDMNLSRPTQKLLCIFPDPTNKATMVA